MGQWSQDTRLLNVAWGKDDKMVDYGCGRFWGARYHRIDPVLSENVHSDDFAQLRRLVAVVRQGNLAESEAWLARWF